MLTCTCHVKFTCSLVYNTIPDLLGLYLFTCSVLAVYQENKSAGPAEVRSTEYRELCVAFTVVLLSVLYLESIAVGKCVRKLYHLTQCDILSSHFIVTSSHF
jgi:hypothetical protein